MRCAGESFDKHLRGHMPNVQQASRRLQSALEIFDADPWPTPIVPSQGDDDLVKSNTFYLSHFLRIHKVFAADMARKTENLDFLDHRVLEFYEETEIMAAKQEIFDIEPEDADDEDEANPKMSGTIQVAASGEDPPKALHTKLTDSGIMAFPQHSPQSPIPDPLLMPGTFTNVICQQNEFFAIPILALTMIDITSAMQAPNARRCVLLSHLEVGLDGVEALCQGHVTIDESTYWRENVRESRVGRLGLVKSGAGGYSEALKQEQLNKGMGRGEWLWFGIKFQRSGKERKKGKGGKWACFGVPVEAMKRGLMEEGTAMHGGGVDEEGDEVPKYEVKVKRMTYHLSIGGIGCMDLWEGAEQWQNGAWGRIKKAMAYNGLLIRIVVPGDETMERAQMRATNEWTQGDEVNVEGKGKGNV